MGPINEDSLINRFIEKGSAQVEGNRRFIYVRETDKAVVIRRENDKEARVPKATINIAIDAVRNTPGIYNDGPTRLRENGITQVLLLYGLFYT